MYEIFIPTLGCTPDTGIPYTEKLVSDGNLTQFFTKRGLQISGLLPINSTSEALLSHRQHRLHMGRYLSQHPFIQISTSSNNQTIEKISFPEIFLSTKKAIMSSKYFNFIDESIKCSIHCLK